MEKKEEENDWRMTTVDATGNPNLDVGGVDAGAKIWRFSSAKSWIRIRKNALTKAVKSIVVSLACCTKEMEAYAGCMYYNTNEFNVSKRTKRIRRGMSLLIAPHKGKDKACLHPTSPHSTCGIIVGMLLLYVLNY